MNVALSTQEAKEIAQTIYSQLGGNRFAAMTGAKNFAFNTDGSLSFHMSSTQTKNKSNICKVVLNGLDLYDMTFYNLRGTKVKQVGKQTDLYCDMLQSVFTEETGLYTRL